MGWTKWREIASEGQWYDDQFDYTGPACYELAIARPQGGGRKIVYVGETKNERTRIREYARNGSHLSKIIDRHLQDGWHLWYHGWAHNSKKQAKAMQDRLLARNDYPWNLIDN